MRVIMQGTSAAMPNSDRYDSGILITVRGRHYLFDCGHGATNQMVAANANPATVGHVFLTHLHYDHIADFAYFTRQPSGFVDCVYLFRSSLAT